MSDSHFSFKGTKTKEISFPLGGIGSGSIGLSGSGRLVDWEIFNKPNKGSLNGFTHVAVKAEADNKVIGARILQGDYNPPFTGSTTSTLGHGISRNTLSGLPHFSDVVFEGEYPFASLKYKDDDFPGTIRQLAFNPLIPLNDNDSSIPGAFFEIEVENTTDIELKYTVCFSLSNPNHKDSTYSSFTQHKEITMIQLGCNKYQDSDPEYGEITLSTDHPEISRQEYWYRGSFFDSLTSFWKDFCKPGKLINRTYDRYSSENAKLMDHQKTEDTCSIAAHMNIEPGSKKTVKFLVTWNYPNCFNYWNPEKCGCGDSGCKPSKGKVWKNYYSTLYKDSTKSAIYGLSNWDKLYTNTMNFKNALFNSSMPVEIIDAIAANISILKSPTALRLEDGSFYGWEGCNSNCGCCEGSCSHVWNYAYALPFLFPKLERSMRYLDFKYNQRDDGSMCFRLQLPLGRGLDGFRSCVDGQFGGVIKAYRDWKLSGDTKWLKSIWQEVKKSIDFAWAETNEDKWDMDKDGVLEGRQHQTHDMELFGPNSWLNGFYLAALKAGAEMAEFLGEEDKSAEYLDLFKRGKAWTDKYLFNGEYYFQLIDLKDKSILEKFSEGGSILGISTEQAYWNEEDGEIKYQIGEGCLIDQVIAQWHANICGLGEVLDKKQTKKALEAIYKYNFKRSFRNFSNPARIYVVNDEAGTVICEWPQDKKQPAVPSPYAKECWSGCEYQTAAHMIQEGLISEGIEIVKAVRERHDGEKRNPWNEFECGSNYARAMSSYSLLIAFSGFEFDITKNTVGFNPVMYDETKQITFLWSVDSAWGTIEINTKKIELKVLGGCLVLDVLKLPFIANKYCKEIVEDKMKVEHSILDGSIHFKQSVSILEGNVLAIILK